MIMRPNILPFFSPFFFGVIAFLCRAWFGPTLCFVEDREGKIVSTHVFFWVCVCMSTNVSYISIFCDELVGLCKVMGGPNRSVLSYFRAGPIHYSCPWCGILYTCFHCNFQCWRVLWFWGFFNIFQNQTRLWGGFFLL